MNQVDIVNFKKEVRSFLKTVKPIAEHWNNPSYTTLMVLVQNLGFDGSDSIGYSLQKDIEKVESILKMIKGISTYYEKEHFIKWVADELDMLYFGYSYVD